MRIDLPTAARREFDCCIIGSGPAGIICALELARRQPTRSILLLEYGEDGPAGRNRLDETITLADPAHHHPPKACTNKGLGGSSATWGGRCVMYDAVDFQPRSPFAEHCTWPQGIDQAVAPFLADAARYFECGEEGFDLHAIPGLAYRPIAEGFREGDVTDSRLERWSRPTRFGPRYARALEEARNIHVARGCEVRELRRGPAGGVGSIAVRPTRGGPDTPVVAKAYVLAAGGQESTRILLRSPKIFAARGGVPPALGKFYQGHLSGKIARVRFAGDPAQTDFGFLRPRGAEYLRRRFQFTAEAMRRGGFMNTALWLDNPPYVDPAHRSGAMSLMYLAMITPGLGRRLAPPTIVHSVTQGRVHRLGAHVRNVGRDLPGSLWTPAALFCRRYLPRRKLPGVFLHNPDNIYALHFHAEQEPTESNRMELGPDGESLVIHYGYTDYDVESVIRAHAALDAWLRACGCGQLEYTCAPAALRAAIRGGSKDGVHQAGTTRMSATPAAGVVDGALAVWGTGNLFVCSSSAFPTSGQANPTFLLGAFAARLAHHLATHALS
jgi:choline dehydrogenase-like flavoprotein